MHHLEFEYSGLKLEDMEKMVREKKILYDHSVKQEEEKYTGTQSLVRVDNSKLPKYINDNLIKYKDWIE